jgi:hypothetical protein
MYPNSLIVPGVATLLVAGGFTTYLTYHAQSTEPPANLTAPFSYFGGFKVKNGDLKKSFLDFDTTPKRIEYNRRERPDTQTAWSAQEFEETTSYSPIDTRGRCDVVDVFVTVVFANGQTMIERWQYHEPPPGVGSLYVPLASRPRPRVQKSVLYQGTDYGHIQSIAPDRKDDFCYS